MVFVVEAIISALLSASLQVLFDRTSPRTNLIEFFQRHNFDEILFKNLETTLLQVNAVLSDAEEKQITNLCVRQWIDELKDAVYHTVDLLDEIHSLALAESQASNSSALEKVVQKHKSKLEKMTNKLDNIAKHKDVLGLEASFSGKISPRLQQTSLVDETEVYGRGTDKKKIMDFLLSGSVGGKEIPVAAIIGIAGVGKTTLAQLLYNDSKVQNHFDKRAWVYISEDFDVFKVTKTLYESITLETCDIKDLNRLQVQLKEILTSAKFLIVLDDVWNEYYNKWDALRNFLKVGTSESRIIVTTRSQGVASTVRAIHTCHLRPLEDEDCWLVFANHAFGSTQAYAPPKLKSIGHEIMKKCRGLPLAAKVMGSLLYSKVDAHEWENILNSNIWDLPSDKSDILPSLRLSYLYLSSHLKQCFAYCSIFPKGYVFEKEKLILLWMAEGFLLQPRSDKTKEEVGIEYFHELLSRSFFQQASDVNKSCFLMHDLINDLAQFASGESCFKFERVKTPIISKKARHFSYVRDHFDDGLEKFDALGEAKFLWTFLPLSLSIPGGSCSIHMTVVDEYLLKQKRLRVLSLSHYGNINKLPDKFGKLLHLRYLDLSHTSIRELPSSVGYLYNLQTILLTHCIQLVQLPDNMRNLINLGHLDLNGTSSLRMMPPKFGMLKSLRILTTFVVSPGGSSIKELGGLSHLGGKLSILELQNVGDPKDAEDADLKNKKNIKELEFSWSSTGRADGEKTILEKLHPHENIEKLSIRGYGGTELPNWLGDSKFSNMVILHLSDCRNCSSLPSLGQLSSLQELHVKKMMVLESIHVEFYGQAVIPFASLCILKFEDMPKWKNWSALQVTGGGFPSLQELHLQKCQILVETPNSLPSLKLLFINECRQLQFDDIMDYPQLQDLSIKNCDCLKKLTLNFSSNLKSLQTPEKMHTLLNSLQTLNISGCPELVSFPEGGLPPSLQTNGIIECHKMELFSRRGLPAPYLTTFSISNCNKLQSMPEQMCTLLSSLQTLNISGCSELVSFPDGGLPPSLQTLTIQNCVKLQSMPEQMHILLALQTLDISDCPELVPFPEGGLPSSLQTLTIKNCVKLQSLPEQTNTLLSSLQTLKISDCPELVSFPEGGLPPSLQTLTIQNCVKLRSMPEQMCTLLTSLQTLDISDCPELVSFPESGLPPSLQTLTIQNCVKLQSMPEKMWTLLTSLQTLDISDCPELVSFPEGGLPPSLQTLTIQNCVKLRSMPEQMHILLALQTLNISNCPELVSFPNGGLSPSLQIVTIKKCVNLTPQNAWGLKNMTSLTCLTIECAHANVISFPDEGLLPTSLTFLLIREFPNLETLNLSGLQHLTLLKSLEIHSCNQLRILSDGSLPSSLSSLTIAGCSVQLKHWCQRDRGIYWDKISHIPTQSITATN